MSNTLKIQRVRGDAGVYLFRILTFRSPADKERTGARKIKPCALKRLRT